MVVYDKRYRILLADDTENFRTALTDAMRLAPCDIDQATDGTGALEAITANAVRHYDLIVLDQVMPGLTGEQIAHKLAEMKRKERVLILTGVRSQDINMQALPGSIVIALLDKSRPVDELSYAINNCLFERDANSREWPRVPIKAMAQFRAQGTWKVGRIWDISHNALQLRTNHPMDPEEITEMKFFLPRGRVAVETRARVIWHRHLDDEHSNAEAHGLYFVDIGEKSHREVIKFVDERADELLLRK